MSFFRTSLTAFVSFLKTIQRKHAIGGAVVLVVLGFVGGQLFSKTPGAAPAEGSLSLSHVQVVSVGGFSANIGPLPVTGKVTSLSQATVLAQTSGEMSTLNRSLGEYVPAGTIIASFENSAQRASVLQAQGAYDAAQAALTRSSGSVSQNSQTTSLTSLQSAYSALDDAIHVRADLLFTNAKTTSPELILTVPNTALVIKLKNERVALETTLVQARALALNASPQDVTTNSTEMLAHLQEARVFLDNLIQAVNETPQSQNASAATLSGHQASLAAARSEVVNALSAVTGAKSGYENNDLAAVQANVKQAQGALAAAQSGLEKTIVRSPISGTIVSLPVTQGSYVTAFTQIAVVSNPNALYVDTHVTPDDAKTLAVGNKAIIDGGTKGVVTFVAPAIDPMTGKIEVKVGIQGDYQSITDGSIVNVALDRVSVPVRSVSAELSIPIVAVKMLPSGPVVFSVTTENTLAAHPVKLGSILSDRIVIVDGLTVDSVIVTDARGLSEGQSVILN